jgi:hypothetical protein
VNNIMCHQERLSGHQERLRRAECITKKDRLRRRDKEDVSTIY